MKVQAESSSEIWKMESEKADLETERTIKIQQNSDQRAVSTVQLCISYLCNTSTRIQLAVGTYSDLQSIWRDKELSIEIKIRLLKTCVSEVLLHAAETWSIKKDDRRRPLAFEMQCYRYILEVKWQDHVANDEVRS